MSYFAVLREAGPAWSGGGISDQPGVRAHAEFMNGLADDGFLLLAGPLAGSEAGRVRALLVVDAAGEDEIVLRLAADPWVGGGQLVTVSVEPWKILVGEERLAWLDRS